MDTKQLETGTQPLAIEGDAPSKPYLDHLEKEEKAPEFIQYFSTHPSTKQRLKLIQNK